MRKILVDSDSLWQRGREFCIAAEKAIVDFSHVATLDLEAARYYLSDQLWIGVKGKQIKREIDRVLRIRGIE